jgi:N-sulfoglucosamine sulfohydrolase
MFAWGAAKQMQMKPCALALMLMVMTRAAWAEPPQPPNILFAISDDQSWPHAGAYGYPSARTPHFDRVASEGVLFGQAFGPTPGCSPTRAAILTGRHNWQIENAGTHWSSFPTQYAVFPDQLEQAGYWIGYTGKGWAPGSRAGWSRNPAGPQFSGDGRHDYAGAFRSFLDQRPPGKPFYFWYGSLWPHRPYTAGSGQRAGIDPDDVDVPPFLPDVPEIRSDVADYLREIQLFDDHLGQMLAMIEQAGELDNTLIIVTSDQGMPFPRAKANLYEYSVHVPLAIRWGDRVPAGRVIDDLIDLIDLTATIYEVADIEPPTEYPISGRSIVNMLLSDQQGVVDPERDAVYMGRERHSSARHDNLGYPMRAIRTHEHLYIRNFHPDRWPAGAPRALRDDGTLGPRTDPANAYADVDASPTKAFLVRHRDHPEYGRYYQWAMGKRPAEELYDIRNDPGCVNNLADEPEYANVRKQLAEQLEAYLTEAGRDPCWCSLAVSPGQF